MISLELQAGADPMELSRDKQFVALLQGSVAGVGRSPHVYEEGPHSEHRRAALIFGVASEGDGDTALSTSRAVGQRVGRGPARG